jgi:hypothetical protein
MTRILGLLAALALAAACSANQATAHVATMDDAARRACADLQAVIQARSTDLLDARSLLGELTQVSAEASASANPIIRTRAVALLADANEMVSGGEGRSLDADLAAMNATCTGGA